MSKRHYLDEARDHFLSGIGIPGESKFVADDFQKDAIQNVVDGNDTLVVAPTGAGKTYIAMEAIRAALLLKKRAVYTTPLKALSNTKYSELKKKFEPDYKVGLLTGDRKIEGDASVVVATTEIYRNELYRSSERYSIVVLDEVHFISDSQRGPVWEESIILTPSSSTLLMLSASITPQKTTLGSETFRRMEASETILHMKPAIWTLHASPTLKTPHSPTSTFCP